MDPSSLTDLVAQHKWVALAALVIGLIVRLLKSDTPLPTIPPRWRPLLALGLGLASGVVDKIAQGTPWLDALIGGALAAFLAMVGHDTVITSLRDGREIGTPKAGPPSSGPILPLLVVGILFSLSVARCTPGQKGFAKSVIDLGTAACVLLRGEGDEICATQQELAPIVKHLIGARRAAAARPGAPPPADACLVPLDAPKGDGGAQ